MKPSVPQLKARGRSHPADANRITQPGSGVEIDIASLSLTRRTTGLM
jgi:hypothetical protein